MNPVYKCENCGAKIEEDDACLILGDGTSICFDCSCDCTVEVFDVDGLPGL